MVSLGLYVSSGKPILAFIKTYWLVFHVFLSFFYLKKKEKSFNHRLIFFVLIPTILVYTHAIPVHGTTLWSWTYYFLSYFYWEGTLTLLPRHVFVFKITFKTTLSFVSQSAVSHNSATKKRLKTFYWTAPVVSSGHVVMRLVAMKNLCAAIVMEKRIRSILLDSPMGRWLAGSVGRLIGWSVGRSVD